MSIRVAGWSDRRASVDRRLRMLPAEPAFWIPERVEVHTQFFTRYLFFALAVIYFSTLKTVPSSLLDVDALLLILGGYFLITTLLYWKALRAISLSQIRSAMAVDLLMVTICVIHDPNPIPPAALAFLMVLLGNGMRYGMRLFAEVLGGALLGMALSFAIRYRFGGFETGAGDVFFGVFWVTLAMYAYILMGHIDRQRRQLDFRSRYDTLTRLLNRHGLLAAADALLDPAHNNEPVTVLFADLNQFKSVNDQYGHAVGDRVLEEFAQIFHESVEGGLCGRWGGDEFVAVLPQHDSAEVQQLMLRIHTRIHAWSRTSGLPMAVSMGVSHAPHDGTDLITLLSVADISLYQNKAVHQTTSCSLNPDY